MEERECDCTLIIQQSSNNKTINLKCMPILSSKIIPETWFFKAWSLKKLLLSFFKKVLLSLLLLVFCILHLISLFFSFLLYDSIIYNINNSSYQRSGLQEKIIGESGEEWFLHVFFLFILFFIILLLKESSSEDWLSLFFCYYFKYVLNVQIKKQFENNLNFFNYYFFVFFLFLSSVALFYIFVFCFFYY